MRTGQPPEAANDTRAHCDMPFALVWPGMHGRVHECRATRETGPCPFPSCLRGHYCDVFYTCWMPPRELLTFEELEKRANEPLTLEIKEVRYDRKSWQGIFRWRPTVLVWIWKRHMPKARATGEPPIEVQLALGESYVDVTWAEG